MLFGGGRGLFLSSVASRHVLFAAVCGGEKRCLRSCVCFFVLFLCDSHTGRRVGSHRCIASCVRREVGLTVLYVYINRVLYKGGGNAGGGEGPNRKFCFITGLSESVAGPYWSSLCCEIVCLQKLLLFFVACFLLVWSLPHPPCFVVVLS